MAVFTFKAEGLTPNEKNDAAIFIFPMPSNPTNILPAIKNNLEEGERLGKWMKEHLTGNTINAIRKCIEEKGA